MVNKNQISDTILTMATERGPCKTICPSEVARKLFKVDWRKYMDDVRTAAVELQRINKIVITQRDQPVDSCQIKGPIRIKIAK